MNVLIDIVHPADVHFFRHAIGLLRQRGHEVAITTRANKDVATDLLANFGFDYKEISQAQPGLLALLSELIIRDIRLFRFARKFDADVLTGISGFSAAHVATLLGKPSVVWDDTEHQRLTHAITYPLATQYQCPDCYYKRLGSKQRYFRGIKEIAYLHPKRFQPDLSVLELLGLDTGQKYCVLRLVKWAAHHDVGQHGLDMAQIKQILRTIGRFARPYITAEDAIPTELQPFALRIPPHKIHDVLASASLCISEGATMAAEACMLAVPTIYVNTCHLGYIDKLEKQGLLSQTHNTAEALKMACTLLASGISRTHYVSMRDQFVSQCIDVTDYIVDVLEAAGMHS